MRKMNLLNLIGTIRLWRILSVAVTVLSICGCSTFLVSEMSSRDPYFHSKPLSKDKIVAIGKLGPDSEKTLGIQDGMVFLGENHSYLIVKGGAELQAVARSDIGSRVEVLDNYHYTEHHLYVQDGMFWGEVGLSFTESEANLTPERLQQLSILGFVKASSSKNGATYTKGIPVEGTILAPLAIPTDIAERLTHFRSISFYPPKDQKAPLNLAKYVAMPFAVALDVVTAPIQILGFGALALILTQGGFKFCCF